MSKEEFEIELFKGIKGVVQEIMIEDYFKVPEEFAWFKAKRGSFKPDNL